MPHTPSQRTTRSGSNASALTLSDIKSLIDSSQAEILKSVKAEISKYGEMFDTVFTRFDEMVKRNEMLTLRVRELENKVQTLSEERHNDESSMLNEEAYHEAEERYKRRKYLVVSGLSEPFSGSPAERRIEDQRNIETLAHVVGIKNLQIRDVTRIGSLGQRRPRLVRFKCSTVDTKVSLLRASRNLKKHVEYENVYVNPDLTKLQREKDRVLRSQLRERRQAGEKVVIRSGRIVKQMNNTPLNQNSEQNFV